MDDAGWVPCESREEWVLMYSLGLSPERIAVLCRTDSGRVRRALESRDRRDPVFFGRRIVLHNQPSLPKRRPLLTWQQKYENLRWFVDTVGRLPRHNGSTWERQCHGFLYLQRREHRGGRLSSEQVRLLDNIVGWYSSPRAPDHWQQRLDDYLSFIKQHGRRPRVESPVGTRERSLMIWVMSQRKRLRAGTMPKERAAMLDAALPEWRGLA
jgi:hypothetical protein